MYVCICHAVTDKDIIKAAENGACSLKDLSNELNVATCCGRCATCALGLLKQCSKQQPIHAIHSINVV
jgi:bacterioferritin-associated ferredoxin